MSSLDHGELHCLARGYAGTELASAQLPGQIKGLKVTSERLTAHMQNLASHFEQK